MKKVLIFIVLFIFLLSGCTKKIEKKDIANYINDKLKLNNYVINGYEEIIDSDGYKDYLWTIKDNDTNITFHILDDYSYMISFGMSNSLNDDYYENMFLKYYNQISKKSNIVLKNNTSGEFVSSNDITLECSYSNKEGINECFKSLEYYKDKLSKNMKKIPIKYILLFESSKLNNIKFYNYSGTLDSISNESYNDMLMYYYANGLVHQNDDVIAEISKSELNNLYNYKYTYKICNSDNCYDNLIAFNNNTISIATLFEILSREKYNIEGDKYHYIVYDMDNNKYEFSYEFSDLYNDGIELYYLKNDERVFYGEYGTLYYDTVNKMFNLNIKLQ